MHMMFFSRTGHLAVCLTWILVAASLWCVQPAVAQPSAGVIVMPFAVHAPAELAYLRDEIPEAMRQQFEKRQLFPCQAVQALDEYIVKELVAAGQGVAVMRADEARPLLHAGAAAIWEKGWLELPLSLGWLARHDSTRRVRSARSAIEFLWSRPGEPPDDHLARISY